VMAELAVRASEFPPFPNAEFAWDQPEKWKHLRPRAQEPRKQSSEPMREDP
jgi:hypothetical protein